LRRDSSRLRHRVSTHGARVNPWGHSGWQGTVTHLRVGPRRQVRPVRAVDQSGGAKEAGRGDPARDPRELLPGTRVPPRFHQRDRPSGGGAEMAGLLPDHHHRLRLSVGGLEGERPVAGGGGQTIPDQFSLECFSGADRRRSGGCGVCPSGSVRGAGAAAAERARGSSRGSSSNEGTRIWVQIVNPGVESSGDGRRRVVLCVRVSWRKNMRALMVHTRTTKARAARARRASPRRCAFRWCN